MEIVKSGVRDDLWQDRRVKGKIYNMVLRPVTNERQETELEVTELKMLRTCARKEYWLYYTKDVDYGAPSRKKKGSSQDVAKKDMWRVGVTKDRGATVRWGKLPKEAWQPLRRRRRYALGKQVPSCPIAKVISIPGQPQKLVVTVGSAMEKVLRFSTCWPISQ